MGPVETPPASLGGRANEEAGTGLPRFAQGSPLLRGAYALALEAHHGSRRRGETDIDHPVAVAEVLYEYGISDEEVLAAAFLHDVIEDTDTDPDEIGARFGERVRDLVVTMTEDDEIEPYAARKAEHRRRVARDRCVSAIYAADKLDIEQGPGRTLPRAPRRSDWSTSSRPSSCSATLIPELPFLPDLRLELELLRVGAVANV